jgi:pyruvate,water dikinase
MFKKLKLFQWNKSGKEPSSGENLPDLFRFKYSCFKMLLDSNAEFLNVTADMEDKLRGEQVFGMSYVRSKSAKAVFHALRMIKNLDDLSGHKYSRLFEILEDINLKIKEVIGRKKEISVTEYVLPYSDVNAEMTDWVGGKNANLGEIKSRIGLPVPSGFAITAKAFESFVLGSALFDEISGKKTAIDPDEPETIKKASDEIRRLILASRVPNEVEEAVIHAYSKLAEEVSCGKSPGSTLRVSLRSSAAGEDSELSFAGQYMTALNVRPEDLITTYKEIVASLYTSRAISYRLNKGIRDEDIAMSVACLQMVESAASGVMYSRNPANILEDNVIITAVWGLGPYAVEGVITPDTYTVGKTGQLVASAVSRKDVQLVCNSGGGLTEIPVPRELQDKPCLADNDIAVLAGYARKLEEHYGCPQDVEWAVDGRGCVYILQSRSLRAEDSDKGRPITPVLSGYSLLIEKGTPVAGGIGFGPAFRVSSDEDLLKFPDGAVLVARHSSPKIALVMKKTRAIITDMGNIAGHMATLAREFAVPTIVSANVATTAIPEGMEVTVDAYSGRVYQGKVPELEAFQATGRFPMKNTPVYSVLREASDRIVPLYLIDPESPEFSPPFCRTLHDISRFVHEMSYREMFKLSDHVSDRKGMAFKLKVDIPLDLYVIDLGSGIVENDLKQNDISPERVASVPLRALLNGLTNRDFQQNQCRPVEFRGFFSVIREQMLAPPSVAERFGDRSYAIISDKYMNFSSRVGYHYSIVDSYCSKTVNMNYITFSFKGGAADDIRRNRRARAIAKILLSLDFAAEVTGDRVNARYQKHELHLVKEKLDIIGRLLQFTRQMDMLMANESSVEVMADNFLKGNYSLEPARECVAP